jgi:hypothetical protein
MGENMKMKFFLIILNLLLLGILSLSSDTKRVAILTEVSRPNTLMISNGYIYIQEKTDIFIYDAKTYQFVKRFGKAGEGPGEFKLNPFSPNMLIVPYKKNKIMVNNLGKVSVFTADGVYDREYKVLPFTNYYPFADNYIALTFHTGEDKIPVMALYMADKKFNKTKPIYITNITVGPNASFLLPFTPFSHDFYEDKLYVVDGMEGFSIKIFNSEGDQIGNIKKDYKPLKIPSAYMENTLNYFKTDSRWKNIYSFFKERIKFRSHFPAIYDMKISNGFIFILTNKMKNQLRQCIMLDLEGKEKKQIFLPVPDDFIHGMELNNTFTFYKGDFFILRENEDEETWELHRIQIK